MSVPQTKQMRRAYGFDEVAIVPGDATINPAMTEVAFRIDQIEFPLPIMAAAMDAVVDPRFAIEFSKLGGLAVLNLEGVQTRYDDPGSVLEEIASAGREEATAVLQRAYAPPIREELIGEREEVRPSGQGGGHRPPGHPIDRYVRPAHLLQREGAHLPGARAADGARAGRRRQRCQL